MGKLENIEYKVQVKQLQKRWLQQIINHSGEIINCSFSPKRISHHIVKRAIILGDDGVGANAS